MSIQEYNTHIFLVTKLLNTFQCGTDNNSQIDRIVISMNEGQCKYLVIF